jgi:hypothetical protein
MSRGVTRAQEHRETVSAIRNLIVRDRAVLGAEFDVCAALAQLVASVLPNAAVALYLNPIQGEPLPKLWVSNEVDLADMRAQIDVVERNRAALIVMAES